MSAVYPFYCAVELHILSSLIRIELFFFELIAGMKTAKTLFSFAKMPQQ